MAKARKRIAAGVIGLGSMGLGVARTLLNKGFTVYAYDVRPQVLKDFARAGGKACANPGEVGANAQVVITLVLNAEQTAEVLLGSAGAAPRMARGSVVIASATVAPAFAEELGARLNAIGVHMIDAPVSGGAARAATGQLSIMASGAREAFLRARPVLEAIAAKVYRLGDAPGMGSKVMVNQPLAGVHIAASAKRWLGIRAGVDPNAVRGHFNSAGLSWMFQNPAAHAAAGDYTPPSAVTLRRDRDRARLARSTFPLPLTVTAHQMFIMAGAHGHGQRTTRRWSRCSFLSGIPLPEKKQRAWLAPRRAEVSVDRLLAALAQLVADQGHALLDPLHVRIDRQRTFEVLQRPFQLAALHVDQAVAGQGAEVIRIALDHLVAVLQRLVGIAHQIVGRGALVPALGKVRTLVDHAGESVDRLAHLPVFHVADAAR
jgi:3-hydroxyisobutyrate dehydrogenase-like beta-hydroxyacid dehydrogenase